MSIEGALSPPFTSYQCMFAGLPTACTQCKRMCLFAFLPENSMLYDTEQSQTIAVQSTDAEQQSYHAEKPVCNLKARPGTYV